MSETPIRDRPRERLLRHGASALSDVELLALVLRTGSNKRDVMAVAGDLLEDVGGLSALLQAQADGLTNSHGLGEARAASILAAFELGRRAVLSEEDERPKVRGPEDIVAIAAAETRDRSREEVIILALDRGSRLRRVRRATVGTSDRCLLDPRDVIAQVLKDGASKFAVVHTHPSGDPTPSPDDVAMTKALRNAGATVGLTLLDHLVIAGQRWARCQ